MQRNQPPNGSSTARQRQNKLLTPMEQLNMLDEAFQRALSVKRKTLLELYGEQETSSKEKLEMAKETSRRQSTMVAGTPSEARDLALAAMVQAHCLLEAVYDGTKVQQPSNNGSSAADKEHPQEANQRKTSTTASPSKTGRKDSGGLSIKPNKSNVTIPSVPCSRLACVAAPLMKCLTALSQSCALIERELSQSKKELEMLKAAAVSTKPTVQLVVENNTNEDDEDADNDNKQNNQQQQPPPSPQQISRPADLPLNRRQNNSVTAKSQVRFLIVDDAKRAAASTTNKGITNDKNSDNNVEQTCSGRTKSVAAGSSLSATSSLKVGTKKEPAEQNVVMSRSMPCDLLDGQQDEKKQKQNRLEQSDVDDGGTDEDRRRKRSLQRRWRHFRASLDHSEPAD